MSRNMQTHAVRCTSTVGVNEVVAQHVDVQVRLPEQAEIVSGEDIGEEGISPGARLIDRSSPYEVANVICNVRREKGCHC